MEKKTSLPTDVLENTNTSINNNNNNKNSSNTNFRDNYQKNESRRILRNIIAISLSFMLLFTAYTSTSSLQSSVNEGDGPYSLAIVYGAIVISTIFLPSAVIRALTTKWAMCVSMLGYSTYIIAQYHANIYTLGSAGVIVGICAASLWIGKCAYLTEAANEYAQIRGEPPSVIVTRFFGLFFCLFQTSSIWGNLISSLVLSQGNKNSTDIKDLDSCGVNYCPSSKDDDSSSDTRTDEEEQNLRDRIKILATIYLVIALAAAAVIALFVDPLSRYGENVKSSSIDGLSGKELLLATFKHMKNPKQILIIPLTIWSGIEQGYLGSDVTSAFITCSWGVEKVGYVLICYGLFDAISSVVFGIIVKYTGRIPIFILGALINVASIALMFIWKPNPESPITYFVLVGAWGVADAVWQTQINAVYGVLFADNTAPAYSNYRLFESSGFIIAYVMTSLCIRTKLYILLGSLAVGMLGYFAVEYSLTKKPKISSSRAEIFGSQTKT